MAKIIYGVAGEGFGHSSRAHIIGQWLLDAGHDVIFLVSNKSYRYLGKHFPDRVYNMPGLTFIYYNSSVSFTRTFLHNLTNVPKMLGPGYNVIMNKLWNFEADLVISDFEPFAAFWAKIRSIPCISIDHEQLLTKAQYIEPQAPKVVSYLSVTITKNYLADADAYVILNFFKSPVTCSNAIVLPPVIRQHVLSQKPSHGDHIICYATTRTSIVKFLKIIRKFPQQKFFIYGADQDKTLRNCVFKPHSTDGFLADLASCRGIIATGGFSLISECLHFRKKMLVIPIKNQYEQMVNAVNLESNGYAMNVPEISEEALANYLEFLQTPAADSDGILWPDNKVVFDGLDEVIRRVTNGKVALDAETSKIDDLMAVA